jgi:DNA polymerase ligase (LigD)-like protein
MPRFVVVLHETPSGHARPTHFDLMLESDDALLTWSLREIPTSGSVAMAEQLPNHRLMYLDYEGPVSNDRGHVRRVDGGEFESVERSETRYEVDLRGEKLRGRLVLEQDAVEAHRWRVALSD